MSAHDPNHGRRGQLGWVVHFAAHTLAGTAIFVVIAAPALGIAYLVRYLESTGVPEGVLWILTFLEYAILVLDALLFVAYLTITSLNAVREMRQ